MTQRETQPETQPETQQGVDLHHGEGYTGPADLVVGDATVPVQVDLRGAFQPIDGRFHWHGRVAASADVDALVAKADSSSDVVLRTAYGEGVGRLADPDPWGRFRVTGTGTPPFPL